DSCPHTFTTPNLGSALLDKQLTFSAFSEDLPTTGFAGCSSHQYARKHSPWTNFTNVPASTNRPWSAFPADYNQLPTVSFVVPNLDHDMHNGTISQGDKWLKDNVDPFVQWAKTHNSLLIVTWDEDDASSENRIPTLFVGPMVKPGQYGDPINHFGVLRSIEELYALPLLGQSASAQSVWPF
ncbi:MAG: acid phosphatase, partial [Bacilli bacterium]|nr:acid phosphatase [Bacilli bacterium]